MTNWIDQVRELNELREAGLLTDEEFEEQKRLLLPSNTTDQETPTPLSKPYVAADELPASLPRGLTFGADDEIARRERHSELGGGRYGRREGWGDGHWICHAHAKALCETCMAADRSSRGRWSHHMHGDAWTCFKHSTRDCKRCKRLHG